MSSDDAKAYLSKRSIPSLFECLMTGLMFHRPDEHIQYLIECLEQVKTKGQDDLRWNMFIEMHHTKTPLPPITATNGHHSLSFSPKRYTPETRLATPLPSIINNKFPGVPIIFLMGGPGSEKSTQAKLLINRFPGWIDVNMGELLRQQVSVNETDEKWSAVKHLMTNGELVSDDIVNSLLINKLKSSSAIDGFLIHGYPCNMEQAMIFQESVGSVDTVFLLDYEEADLCSNFMEHSNESKLSVTNVDAFSKRIQLFREKTLPVLKHFDILGKLYIFEGERDCEEIAKDLLLAFETVTGLEGRHSTDDITDTPEMCLERTSPRINYQEKPLTATDEVDNSFTMSSNELPPEVQVKDEGRMQDLPKGIIIFFAGGPGSRKRNHCQRLISNYDNAVHLSLGDLLRSKIPNEVSVGDPNLEAVKLHMQGGNLINTDTILDILITAMKEHFCSTFFLIEGFPRDKFQLESFNMQIGGNKFTILLDCNESSLRRNLNSRCEDGGRLDDNHNAVETKLNIFKHATQPTLKILEDENKLIVVNGEREEDEVQYDLRKALDYALSGQVNGSVIAKDNEELVTDDVIEAAIVPAGFVPVGENIANPSYSCQLDSTIAELRIKLKNTKVVFVIGGPGSGKGTQCDKIVERYGFTHLSTGDLLRREVQSRSKRGRGLVAVMEKGELISMDIVLDLLTEAMVKNLSQSNGFLIDGYPRELEQGVQFEEKVTQAMFAIFFDVSDDTMTRRLLGRAVTSGRVDDNEETIKRRVSTFRALSQPLIDYYEKLGKLKTMPAEDSPDQVFVHVREMFDQCLPGWTLSCLSDATVVFVIGGPGSGKGTQCSNMVREYGFCHLSTGDLLRTEVASSSEHGKRLNSIMENGDLVSLDEVLGLLKNAMLQNMTSTKCFLIDGYPRQLEQGIRFESEIVPCMSVLYFDVSNETMTRRLLDRGKASGRVDDNEETIKKRLATFHTMTTPIIDFYRKQGKVEKISAEGEINEVFLRVKSFMDMKKL